MLEQHNIPVRVVKHLDALSQEAHSMTVNLYHTDSYLVINTRLPGCLPEKVHVFEVPAKIQVHVNRTVLVVEAHQSDGVNVQDDIMEGDINHSTQLAGPGASVICAYQPAVRQFIR